MKFHVKRDRQSISGLETKLHYYKEYEHKKHQNMND